MDVRIEEHVATIVMNEGKGNSFDPAMVRRIRETVGEAGRQGARAAVLTGAGSIFSAGLNLPVLSAMERGDLRAFILDFTDMLIELASAPFPLVAAINGHAIAGGAILAFACDYRLMARDDYRIGLNEVDLGIRYPTAALELALHVLPKPSYADVILLGRLMGPEEAQAYGMVHQLADSKLLVQSARTVAFELATKPGAAVASLKADLARDLLARVRERRESSAEEFLDSWFSAQTRERVRAVCESLAARG